MIKDHGASRAGGVRVNAGTASNGPPTLGAAWTDVAALNPLRLLPGGQPPRTSSQVVIDKHSADVGHFTVGDKVVVLTQLHPATYTITGIATWGSADSPLGASITAFDPVTAARVLGQPGKVSGNWPETMSSRWARPRRTSRRPSTSTCSSSSRRG
jgi:putative ABC transport system permease protein